MWTLLRWLEGGCFRSMEKGRQLLYLRWSSKVFPQGQAGVSQVEITSQAEGIVYAKPQRQAGTYKADG